MDIRFIITAARLEREEAGTRLDSRTHALRLTGTYVGEALSSYNRWKPEEPDG